MVYADSAARDPDDFRLIPVGTQAGEATTNKLTNQPSQGMPMLPTQSGRVMAVRVGHRKDGMPLGVSEIEMVDIAALNPLPALVVFNTTRICETVPTSPRAVTDRPRALGYSVWMRTIDT